MSNANETITDIIRKIRAEADSIEASARGSLKVGEGLNGVPFTESDLEPALDLVMTKRKEADRLEAAHKCEKATAKKSSAVGDGAKLREALEAAHQTLKLVYENAVEFIQPRLADEIIHTGSAIEAALAAPARNCDRFDSFPQAYDEWYKTEVLPRVCGVIAGAEPPFDSWLFTKASKAKRRV